MKRIFIAALLISSGAFASIEDAARIYAKNAKRVSAYPLIAQNLIDDGLYFSAIPFVKEYISSSSRVSSTIGPMIDEIISQVGVRQFEALPSRTLQKVNLPITNYILAKKYFRAGKYRRVLQYVNTGIPDNHSIKPYALMLEGSTYAVMGKNAEAISTYKKCLSSTSASLGDAKDKYHKRQLTINYEYCLVGIPRVEYAMGRFEQANDHFMDLPKGAYIWPEILFEEAWNSFFAGDYNRTLGKLVTYKAPVMGHIFNPEVDVLRALTYLELCLYQDAKSVVDKFYKRFQRISGAIDKMLSSKGKNYKYYYQLAKNKRHKKYIGNRLLNNQMESIVRDPSYVEMQESFLAADDELGVVKQMRKSQFKSNLIGNLKQALTLQRNLIGSYIYKQIKMNQRFMNKTFESMSYIKLEVLSRKKHRLYEYEDGQGRERGDIKNLIRTDRQYFWNFNGEFWADELGDYVFSLKSECKK